MRKRDVIAIEDFSAPDIWRILELAKQLKDHPEPHLLKGYLLGSCFFEPSTRTRLSFESAMLRLGGNVMGFSEDSHLSTKKGESLHDTMKMMEAYVDVVVLRHFLEGAAQKAADALSIPVINAGDGANQHPTQAFVDLFTIWECQGRLEHLSVAIVGDLKYGRTTHSLTKALTHFKTRMYFVAPPLLEMPKHICDDLRERGTKFSFHQSIDEVIEKVDILYMTRIQSERFNHPLEYEDVKKAYALQTSHLAYAKSHLKVLHPLPRVSEVDRSVDHTAYAHYFQQARNAVDLRQAVLALVLGEV
jgi:aspartate carbamoyltransferase catalytic subunit